MLNMVQVGRWLALATALFCLTGCVFGFGTPEERRLRGLVTMARTDLEGLLGTEAEVIALESISAATFPCPTEDCSTEPPSYVIRLQAGDRLYQYQAKEVGGLRILWRELPTIPTPREGRISASDAASVATK